MKRVGEVGNVASTATALCQQPFLAATVTLTEAMRIATHIHPSSTGSDMSELLGIGNEKHVITKIYFKQKLLCHNTFDSNDKQYF